MQKMLVDIVFLPFSFSIRKLFVSLQKLVISFHDYD